MKSKVRSFETSLDIRAVPSHLDSSYGKRTLGRCGLPSKLTLALMTAAMLLPPQSSAQADVFRYKDGRVIAGATKGPEVETLNQVPVKVWAVEVEQGVYIRVLESELELNGHSRLSEARQQYAANVGGIEQTVATHSALAGECMKQGLTDLAHAHYRRILDLDPQNGPARVASGFRLDENNRWVKKEVVMGENRGKVLDKGRWKFPEMLAIEQAKEEQRQQVLAATRDLHRWHNSAMTARGPRLEDALQNISQINDPLTTGTLVEFLLEARRPVPPELKLLYVEVLSRMQNADAAAALARASMTDANEQVRNACLSALGQYGREVAIPIYVGYLRSKTNAQINSAARALRQLGAEQVFFPLVKVLTTKHLQASGGGGGINASPTSGSFSVGGDKPVEVEVSNQDVLSALSSFTGQSFGFDRSAWIQWYATLHAPPAGDVRRDP